jgi:hypothetical protein
MNGWLDLTDQQWVWLKWAGRIVLISLLLQYRTIGAASARAFDALVRFYKRRQQQAAIRLSTWWACRTKKCDYYHTYQAYGPAELTHVGFHAGERLALEHFLTHSDDRDDAIGCAICKEWAVRLRGDLWKGIIDTYGHEQKIAAYGFHGNKRDP